MKNKKTGLRVGSHTQIRRRTEVTEQKGTKMVSYISVPIQYCTTHKHFVRLQLGSSGAFYTAARPRASKHQFCSLMMQIIMFLEACQTYLLGPPEYLIFFACCLGSSSAKTIGPLLGRVLIVPVLVNFCFNVCKALPGLLC